MLRYIKSVTARLEIEKSGSLLFFRAFYAANFWMLLKEFNSYWEAVSFDPPRYPVEIVFWLKYMPYPYTLFLIVGLAFVSATATIWRVEQQLFRVACFIFVTLFHASTMDPDQINHNTLFFIYPLFLFMWIPTSAWRNFEGFGQKWIAKAIHVATLSVGLFMTSAGLVKIIRGIHDGLFYNEGIFVTWNGFGQILVDELPVLEPPTRVALMVFNHPVVFHIFFLAGVLGEAAAVFLAIRPKFYRILGIWFLGFQMATSVFMDIYFEGASLIMFLFLFASPLKERWDANSGNVSR